MAVRCNPLEGCGVFRRVIFHQVPDDGMEPARKPCPLHFAKVVFQALQHRFFIFRPVCPGEKGLAVWGLPGIGKVEYIFQPKLRACILQEGDAHGPRLDPAAVAAPVPLLQRGAGGGVWALGIDENQIGRAHV